MNVPSDISLQKRGQWLLFVLFSGLMIIFTLLPDWDFAVSRYFYDAASARFPLAHDFFWQDILHDGFRNIMRPIQIASFIAFAISLFWLRAKAMRKYFGYFWLTSMLSAALVAALKSGSGRVCPAQLIEFGGTIAYQPLWSGVVELAGARCWPGGHVLHAFTLLPVYFVLWRMGYARASVIALSAILILGLALNLTQIVRGAHFLSHNLWSLWLCWTMALVLDRVWQWSARKRYVRSPKLLSAT